MAVVIGGGLAGCEAAWALAQRGIKTVLYEMRPVKNTPAHKTDMLCELICSNSLKAKRVESAAGLLKEEMRRLGSLTLSCADECEVEAGGALAVDRDKFSALVSEKIENHPLIEVRREEITKIPEGEVIIAAGPLCSDTLSKAIKEYIGEEYLSFFDAASPIVTRESIDFKKAFFASRYERGGADYINCPFEKDEYKEFYDSLVSAETAPLHSFEKSEFRVYEGCMPVETMAKRGEDTLRFGPLKPVGIYHPETNKKFYAVVQLRAENKEGSLYNLVGFQTNLKFPEQEKVFRMIPGLENADFVRYGVMHRNTFLNSPRILDKFSRLRKNESIYFAGQITGVEGYMESAASGIMCGINLARQILGEELLELPKETMIGSLLSYISDESVENFQPMGANMGILPAPPKIRDKKQRYEFLSARSLEALEAVK